MGIFSKIFQSKEKRKNAQKYKIGMEKTRSSVLGNLQVLLNSSTKINDTLYDELEKIFIMADIGVDTVIKIVDHLRKKVEIDHVTKPKDLTDMIVDEMFQLYVRDEIVSSNLDIQDNRLNVVLFVGVNGVGVKQTGAPVGTV